MLDGVGWAAAEIVGFMIVATVIGLGIGWIFGRWLQRASIAEAYQAELEAQEELARKAEHRLIESNNNLDKLHDQLRIESAKVGELETQLMSAEEAIGDLEGELAAAGGSDNAFAEIKLQRDSAREQAGQLRDQVEALNGEAAHAWATVDDRSRELEESRAGLESMARSLAELEERITAAEDAADAVPGLRAELQHAVAGRDELADQVAVLEMELDGAREYVSQLEGQLGEARSIAGRVPGLQAELEQARANQEDLAARVDILQVDLQGELEYVGNMERQLSEATNAASRVPDLEAALSECASGRSDLSVRVQELEAQLAAVPQPAPTKAEAVTLIAAIAERTAGGMAAPHDDLKEIRGIGPKLEQTLNDLGITSFRQIANLRPDDIVVITAALPAFKGRIERHDWMGGAAAEHLKKYGEPA